MSRRWGSRNEWASSYFKWDHIGKKHRCQFEGADGKKCSHACGAKTSKQNWVDHLTQRHKVELPAQFTPDFDKKDRMQTTILASFHARNLDEIQVEKLVHHHF